MTHDRDFNHDAERWDDAEWHAMVEEVISEEPEFIEAVQEYWRNGQTEVGKRFLIERFDYLLSRCESWADERLEDKRRGNCA